MDSDTREYNSLNIWRVVFTVVIMLFHLVNGSSFYDRYPMIKYHWYIAVEFFFILSGYLLMQHVDNHKEESSFSYLKGRIWRLYPEYLLAFLVMASIRSYESGLNIFKIIVPNWLEAVMLQSIGTNIFPYINNPAWYVSALTISSCLIHYLLSKHRELYLNFVGPGLVIVIFSYLYRKYERLELFYHTEGVIGNTAILRAVMSLTVGVYVYYVSMTLKPRLKSIPDLLKSVMQIFAFGGVLAFSLLREEGSYDFFFMLVFACGIILASSDSFLGKLSNTYVVSWLSKHSYCMYLSHFAAIFFLNIFWNIGEEWFWEIIPVYILITMLLAAVYSCICDKVRKVIMRWYL